MGKDGPKSRILTSEKLHIENKTLFVDLKENDGGRFVQIAELSNDRRSTVVIPFSGYDVFLEALSKVAKLHFKTTLKIHFRILLLVRRCEISQISDQAVGTLKAFRRNVHQF